MSKQSWKVDMSGLLFPVALLFVMTILGYVSYLTLNRFTGFVLETLGYLLIWFLFRLIFATAFFGVV